MIFGFPWYFWTSLGIVSFELVKKFLTPREIEGHVVGGWLVDPYMAPELVEPAIEELNQLRKKGSLKLEEVRQVLAKHDLRIVDGMIQPG